jgi:uncharacterized membrane protein
MVDASTRKRVSGIYHSVIQDIAFVPTIFSVVFTALAFGLISLHKTEIGSQFVDTFPFLFMRSASHAADVVTTLLQGVISLTVFSFSVVMIILNQASQNLIPKMLYKFTEDKFMQVVLGFYIGTIIYYIILLVNFGKEDDELYVPDLAFLFGIMLAINNFFLFVYFIHRTTVSIHTAKLTRRLYEDTIKKLNKEKKKYTQDEVSLWVEKENFWITHPSHSEGYIQSVQDELVDYLAARDLVVKIVPVFGEFIIKKMDLFSVNRSVEKDVLENIESSIIFYDEHKIGENSKYGFSQITEIAVKALSTGVNDPGTAIICLNFLTNLLCKRVQQDGGFFKKDTKGAIRIIAHDEPFENLLYKNFTPIRSYGKADVIILDNLVKSLVKISLNDNEKKYQESLNKQLKAILETAKENIQVKTDFMNFLELITFNCRNTEYFNETLEAKGRSL